MKISCIRMIAFILALSFIENGNAAGSADSSLATAAEQAIKSAQGGNGLASILTSQLGVSQEQALGGAGALFKAAKENLDPQTFTALSQSVPGMSNLLGAAPQVSKSGAASELASMLGGLAVIN